MTFDDFRLYLPKYLSSDAEKFLFDSLKQFPGNIDQGLYSTFLTKERAIFQGDGITRLPVINLPDPKVGEVACMIFSNTCDMAPENKRHFPSRLTYAPIFNLEKYRRALLSESGKSKTQISSHIEAIKKQLVTQVFYLPALTGAFEESIVFFDRINNCPAHLISPDDVPQRRLFTLSDYGFYLFLFKLSVHFTRVQEKVERGQNK